MKAITSRQNPLVQQCRDLARRRPFGSDDVLLDGLHLITDALDAGVPLVSVLVAQRVLETPDGAALVRRLARTDAALQQAPDAVLEAASPVKTPTGILAIARLRQAPPDAVWAPPPALAVCAVGVQDPGNVGAIIRAADAAGATGALVTDGSADPLGWKALRGSMGSALRLPLRTGLNAASACDEARRRGLRVIATSPGGGDNLYDVDFRGPTLVLVGGEGPGLPDALVAAADVRLRIPMRATVESLNAAVAAAVVLFEAHRQRRGPARS